MLFQIQLTFASPASAAGEAGLARFVLQHEA